MKIGLFLEANLSKPGGVQEYVRGIYDYLKKQGHKVCIVVPGRPVGEREKRERKILGKRLELERIAEMIGTSASAALTYAPTTEIKEFLACENFDLLHFQAPFGLLGCKLLWVAQKQKVACVATFHVYRKSNLIPNLVNLSSGPILEKLSASLDCRIALSRAAEEFAQKMFPGKYLIIPAGVDLERFNPEGRRVKKYLDKKKNILFVGRLDYRKGILVLLEAFLRMRRETRLIIVGKGPEERKAKRFVRTQRMENVELVGYVTEKNLPKFYRTADVICFPSLQDESFGIVLLEAMASGKPVVASDIPGYREVLRGELGRLLFPPRDSEALAETILSLLEDESLRQDYAQRSLRTAQEYYSWESVGERILEVYKSIL